MELIKAKPKSPESDSNTNQNSGKKDWQIRQKGTCNPLTPAEFIVNSLPPDYDRDKLLDPFYRLSQLLEIRPELETPLILGVTSMVRGEGRTTTALGLALAISSQQPLPVVLVETDLSNPTLAEELELPNFGLNEFLRDELTLAEILLPSSLPEMKVIVAGNCRGNPLQMLRRERLNDFFKLLSQQFAVVVVDVSPLCAAGEAGRVINQLDQVLLVVHATRTPARLVKSGIAYLSGAKFGGVILNRTQPSSALLKLFKRLSG